MAARRRDGREAIPVGSNKVEFNPPREFEGVTHKDLGEFRERLAVLETKVKVGAFVLGAIVTAIIGVAIVKLWERFL